MREFEGLPRILSAGQARCFGSISEMGKTIARSNPVLRFGARFGAVADKMYMTPDLCLLHLARKVGATQEAAHRAQWFGGRLVNRLTGVRADYVPLSGAVLAGVLRYLDEDVPDALDRRGDYLLRRDLAEDYLARFRQRAKADGMSR